MTHSPFDILLDLVINKLIKNEEMGEISGRFTISSEVRVEIVLGLIAGGH